jgi:hypothetical protein
MQLFNVAKIKKAIKQGYDLEKASEYVGLPVEEVQPFYDHYAPKKAPVKSASKTLKVS